VGSKSQTTGLGTDRDRDRDRARKEKDSRQYAGHTVTSVKRREQRKYAEKNNIQQVKRRRIWPY
jgi:hypothetical protein